MKYKNIVRFMMVIQFVREVFCLHDWAIYGPGSVCTKCKKRKGS